MLLEKKKMVVPSTLCREGNWGPLPAYPKGIHGLALVPTISGSGTTGDHSDQ
jgi:hypothetical protein